MKIVFFGTSSFAIPPLRALLSSDHKVVCAVTQPDRQKGRGRHLMPPPVKVLARNHNIPVYQPVNVSSAGSIEQMKMLGADLFVVVSFGQILNKEMLGIPKHCAINIHGSILPKYRGAAPTNRAIINGDKSTGVTIMKMSEKLDEGEIMLTREVAIDEDDTNITLNETLADAGAEAMMDVIAKIEKGEEIALVRQDPSKATYAPKLKKKDGLIDWTEPAEKIRNKVRGYLPWPGAYLRHEGKVIKVLEASVVDDCAASGAKSGEVIALSGAITVKAGAGAVRITHLQLEGKAPMEAAAFLRGHRIPIGAHFT